MQITDDAHYERSLKWLTERAAQIEAGDKERNPLKRDAWKAERARLMVNYDIVAEALKRYTQPEIFGKSADVIIYDEVWTEKPKKSVLENFL
jgi:hypothetical protein